MPMPLERTQQVFAAALGDGAQAAALLQELDAADARTAERIDLYRGNLTAVWGKALANAYPVVRQLVGEEFFDGLAREYGRAYPSQSGDLNVFGDRFAAFLSTFPHVQSLPYLPDVARLDWLVHQAHYSADAQTVKRNRFAGLPPEQLLTTRFSLNPAVVWIESSYPIATLWQAHQPQTDVALPGSLDQSECALVVRPQWRSLALSSSAAEAAALTRLHEGEDMAGAIEAALQIDSRFDFGMALLRWIEYGVLVDLE